MRQFFSFLFSFLVLNTFGQTTINGSFVHNGINRTYRLYIPESYNPGNQAPLVMNLHGYGSSNIEQEFYGDFRPIADTAGFLLVHPNGTPDNFNTNHWNTFGTSTVDDVGFLSALIDTLAANYNVDLERVYSTGMSNGGFMSFHLACFLSERIAAIASVTGTMTPSNFNNCDPQRPVPVMQIHGTLDGTVPYNGNFFFVPVQSLLDFWVTHNNCDPEPIITEVPDIDPTDGCTAENHLYPNGDNGSVVEHNKVLGGGHSWPGAPVNINITNMDFSASEEIWRFFRQYTLDGLVTGQNEIPLLSQMPRIYPNPSQGTVNIDFHSQAFRQITVLNQLGQVVYQAECHCESYRFNLEVKGVYVVRITADGFAETFKLLNQ